MRREQKKLFIVLVICAVGIYLWNAVQLFNGLSPAASKQSDTNLPQTPAAKAEFVPIPEVLFEKKGKNPFSFYKEKPKPPKPVIKKPVVVPKQEVHPPRITITGIMWNPSNPVAMLRMPDGSNAIANVGKNLMGSIQIQAIEKDKIQVLYKGKSFWIKK